MKIRSNSGLASVSKAPRAESDRVRQGPVLVERRSVDERLEHNEQQRIVDRMENVVSQVAGLSPRAALDVLKLSQQGGVLPRPRLQNGLREEWPVVERVAAAFRALSRGRDYCRRSQNGGQRDRSTRPPEGWSPVPAFD